VHDSGLNKQDTPSFHGPILLVGMPRSGTKLLREMLNNHSLIDIPSFESHFIPYFSRRIDRYGDLTEFTAFKRLYEDMTQFAFFHKLSQHEDFSLDARQWYLKAGGGSFGHIVETFYIDHAHRKGKRVWGDKTPFHLVHLPMLKKLFPEARFIHIIRDVRDHCLSARKAWHKNYYRSAQRWTDYISKCRQDARQIPTRGYLEVQYEQLIDSPAETMEKVCAFIGVSYEERMIKLIRPTENMGSARGQVGILNKNYGKWKGRLSVKQIDKIEKICGPLLAELGYGTGHGGKAQRLGRFESTFYKLMDAFYQIRFESKKRGGIMGFRRVWRQLNYAKFH
jgi:hypothetical protein